MLYVVVMEVLSSLVVESLLLITINHYITSFVVMVVNSTFSCADCILNMHESERCQARRCTACAWMPFYDEKKAPCRPTHGYESSPARRARLEHQCLGFMLQPFEQRTAKKKTL